MDTPAPSKNPLHEAIFSLLPHFGITGVTNVEEGITKLTAEMSRVREEEPERYQAVLLQAKGEMQAFSALLDQYRVEIEKVKKDS